MFPNIFSGGGNINIPKLTSGHNANRHRRTPAFSPSPEQLTSSLGRLLGH